MDIDEASFCITKLCKLPKSLLPPKIQNPKRFWSQAFWIKDTQNAICTDIDYHVNSIGTFKSKRFVEMASLMTPTTVSAT